MKELDALMKALDEKGIIKAMRMTAKIVPFPESKDTAEKKQALLDEAIKNSLAHHFADDETLGDMFGMFAYELGMNALVKELGIKAPEESPEMGKILAELLKNL
jgi:hypothetical protein